MPSKETGIVITPMRNPFKGPESFTENDKDFFFGREKEVSDIVQLIDQYTLTLLYSKSGVGKTSLINAGILPLLENYRSYLPVYIRLNKEIKNISGFITHTIREAAAKKQVAVFTGLLPSGNYPLTDFIYFSKFYKKQVNENVYNKEVLEEFSYERQVPEFATTQTAEAGQIFNAENQGAGHTGAEPDTESSITQKINAGVYTEVVPIVIFDQFEEIFTLEFDSNDLNAFLVDVSNIIESRIPEEYYDFYEADKKLKEANKELKRQLGLHKLRLQKAEKWYRVMFSFREEYLASFESLKELLPSVFYSNGRYQLQTFDMETAIDIIVKTSAREKPIDKDTAALLVNVISKTDAKSGTSKFKKEVHPFLLSLICKELYAKLVDKDPHLMNELEAQELNTLDNIIADYCNKVFAEVDPSVRAFVEDELITRDGKRILSPIADIQEKKLKEIRKLLSPNLRYLNTIEYFDNTHIEILHDKLLKPLIISRKRRERRWYLTKIGIITGSIIAAMLGIVAILYIQSKKKTETLRKYDVFLTEINKLYLNDLDSNIEYNSIGALIKISDYNERLLKTFSMTDTVKKFQDTVVDRFKGKPFFFTFPATNKEYTYSEFGLYRCYIEYLDSNRTDNRSKSLFGFYYSSDYASAYSGPGRLVLEKLKAKSYQKQSVVKLTISRSYPLIMFSKDSLLCIYYESYGNIYRLAKEKLEFLEKMEFPANYQPLKFSNDGRGLILYNLIYKKNGYSFVGYKFKVYPLLGKFTPVTIPYQVEENHFDVYLKNGSVNYVIGIPDHSKKVAGTAVDDGYIKYIFHNAANNQKSYKYGYGGQYIRNGYYILHDSAKTYLVDPDFNQKEIPYPIQYAGLLKIDHLFTIDNKGVANIYSMSSGRIISDSAIKLDVSDDQKLVCYFSPDKETVTVISPPKFNFSLLSTHADTSSVYIISIKDSNLRLWTQLKVPMTVTSVNYNSEKSILITSGSEDKFRHSDYTTIYYKENTPKNIGDLDSLYRKFKAEFPDSILNRRQ